MYALENTHTYFVNDYIDISEKCLLTFDVYTHEKFQLFALDSEYSTIGTMGIMYILIANIIEIG